MPSKDFLVRCFVQLDKSVWGRLVKAFTSYWKRKGYRRTDRPTYALSSLKGGIKMISLQFKP